MKVIGGPIDGADIPRHSSRGYMMVTFYDIAEEDYAQNFVYQWLHDYWSFDAKATNCARRELRTGENDGDKR